MVRDGLFIFNSVHKVMRAEETLKSAGLDVRLMPVPRSLSSDCGLALAFPLADRERAAELLDHLGLVPAETHRQVEGGYQRLS